MWRRTENSADARELVHERPDCDEPHEGGQRQTHHDTPYDRRPTSGARSLEPHVGAEPQPAQQPEHEPGPAVPPTPIPPAHATPALN